MSLVALFLLVVSVVFRVFPPKTINHWYGYRTSGSMKNQEAWKIANTYSATLMIWFFAVLTLLAFGLKLLSIHSVIPILILIFLAFAVIIILTKRKLKANK